MRLDFFGVVGTLSKHAKNIDIGRGNFPDRLRQIREDHHLSKGDLAERSGLTYRTIHDIEQGKRKRVQEKTLLMIARALEISLDELLNGDVPPELAAAPATTNRGLWIRAAVLSFAGIFTLGILLWWVGVNNAPWTLEDGDLVVRHGTLGTKLWSTPHDEEVATCEESAWDPERLILVRARTSRYGGVVQCVERSSGEVHWTVGPDVDALVAAFGEEDVLAAGFSCRTFGYPDMQGDGDPELLVKFTHGMYYPTAICLVGRDGTVRSQYCTKGHVMSLVYADLDGDGRDEVVGGGTNNAKAYQGAMLFILDDGHASGASVDERCDPWSTEPDSALVRVVLPQFPEPYMEQLAATRLGAWDLQVFRNPNGETRLSCNVGGPDPEQRILVHFDAQLNPIGAEPTDKFREIALSEWPDSLTVGTGPTDPVWLARWLQNCRRFEAGHWPPLARSH